MLSLHPETYTKIATQLHEERIAEVANAALAQRNEGPGRVRHSTGHALARAGAWLLGPTHS